MAKEKSHEKKIARNSEIIITKINEEKDIDITQTDADTDAECCESPKPLKVANRASQNVNSKKAKKVLQFDSPIHLKSDSEISDEESFPQKYNNSQKSKFHNF